jgi:katanin p80 WD40 repeat-containing subunit B1
VTILISNELNICRHLGVSLELLVKLVRTLGPMIHMTVSAGPSSVGVDLEAEQRYCFR